MEEKLDSNEIQVHIEIQIQHTTYMAGNLTQITWAIVFGASLAFNNSLTLTATNLNKHACPNVPLLFEF